MLALPMRLLPCVLCLATAAATAAPSRSARLLQAEDVPVAPAAESPPIVEVEPVPAPVPQAVLVPAPTAAARDRSAKLMWGVATVGGLGVLAPGALVFAGIVAGLLSSNASSPVAAGLLLAGLGVSWGITPLVVTAVMDGFPVGGRALLGALAGWAGGILLAVALSVTPLAWLGGLCALAGPGMGALVAIDSAPDEAFLPPAAAQAGMAVPVVPLLSARF